MSLVRQLRPSTIVAAACVGAVLVYALTAAGPYGLRLLTMSGIYALNVIGYQFIFGHAGALSLAQATFFGLGAYTSALLGLHFGLDFAATFPASIVVATAVALVVAVPVLRLETHYLALATLAISQVALLVAVNWQDVTGGANGLPAIPGIALFGLTLGRGLPAFAAVWLCLGAGLALAAWILSPRRRLRLQLQRERPIAAAAVGIDGDRLRLAALLLSAAYGGAAGALYVHTTRVVSPDALAFSILVLTLAMTVIGGRLTLSGALIGALLLTHIPEWFRFLDRYYLLAYGLAMLAMVAFAPNGMSDLIDRSWAPRKLASARPDAVAKPGRRPAGREPALAMTGLSKSFGGVTAVDIDRLDIPAGQICGIIGPNGSGKTTLLNLISGFESADAGTIAAFGEKLTGRPAYQRPDRRVARCFQHPMLLDDRSVLENVAVSGPSGRPPAQARAAALAWLDRCGLAEAADRPCETLAFGQRRLTEVARALAGDPDLVLLDEPAAGLAAEDLQRLVDLIVETRGGGVTWLVVDHNIGFLAALADRLVCMENGRVIADGTPDAVLRDPAVRRAYFGAPPAVGATP